MNASSYPSNFLIPFESSGPKQLDIGKTTYQLSLASKVARKTVAGKPVAVVQLPSGEVHELHEKGQRRLMPSEQKKLKESHFSKP